VCRSLWAWLGKNEAQIKIVFALVAAAYVIFEYNAHVESTRVERSVAAWKEVRQGGFYKSASALNQFYTSNDYKQWLKTTTPETYHHRLIEELEVRSLSNDIYALRGLYGGVAICAKSNLCDKGTTCTLFFDEIQAFRETYRQHLKMWEETLGDHSASDIEEFALKLCKDQVKAYCVEVPQSPDCS
jgi:hypothetical protein